MAGVGSSTSITTIFHHHPHHHRRTLIPTPQSQSQSQSQFQFQTKLMPYHSSAHPIQFSHFNLLSTIPCDRTNSLLSASASASASATPYSAVDGPTHQHDIASSSTGACWSEFAQNVSGEWDGYGADFTIDGNPIELPENVVPEAFREWEIQVFDWQTQCPTLANPQDFCATYKLIKLLPTVGCEADAATRYSVDDRNIGGADNMVSAFAYHSSGCYTAVWKTEGSLRVMELEHCLIDPRDKESRVRIIQVVVQGDKKLALKTIRVFVEQWYGPFRNGEQLGGCAIRDSAFASTQALDSSQVSGAWISSNSVASFQNLPNSIFQELVLDGGEEQLVRDQYNLILLPKNLWSSTNERKDGETCFEVGWLLEGGRAITSKCIFSGNSELKEIVLSSETAAKG